MTNCRVQILDLANAHTNNLCMSLVYMTKLGRSSCLLNQFVQNTLKAKPNT